MRARVRAAALLSGVCGAALAACLEDRPRPAPPTLEISLSRDTVRSPDTLTGSIRVQDDDGIDSVWVTVDSVRRGDDALFDRVFVSPFRFAISGGHVLGDRIPVRVEARDIVGYVGVLDTVVVVRAP